MMNDTCLTPAACAPHATILSYCDAASKPADWLAATNRPILSKACAPRARLIKSLGALGMDRASASTFLTKTEQLFASNDGTRDA